MGGQACILYGAAEFTRDVDFAVAVGPENLDRLRAALDELEAEPVFFPLLSAAVLRRGHACHFRLRAAGLHGLRIDVMSKMRGVERVAALSLPDLVKATKTQRDKDWPRLGVFADPLCAPRSPTTRNGRPALLENEEDRERQQDRLYWAPLRSELERWRRSRPR